MLFLMRYVKYQSQMFCPWPHFESKDFVTWKWPILYIFSLAFFLQIKTNSKTQFYIEFHSTCLEGNCLFFLATKQAHLTNQSHFTIICTLKSRKMSKNQRSMWAVFVDPFLGKWSFMDTLPNGWCNYYLI